MISRQLALRTLGAGLVVIVSVIVAGCASLNLKPLRPQKADKADTVALPALPNKNQIRISQFVLYCNLDLKPEAPLFQELAELPTQVYKELGLPHSGTLVQVYLFEDRPSYERFMQAKYPDLPKRRAFFVAQPKGVGGGEDLLVYTYWGDKIREDLRHEMTHALLHSVLKDVPLWLDEGLAEYFEVDPAYQGISPRHLEHIRHNSTGGFRTDLTRLEQVGLVSQMSPADYREAWAWVHFMLREKPEGKAVLTAFLQQLRTNPNPGLLQPRLAAVFPDLNTSLNQHLTKLETVRLPVQNAKK